MWVACPSAAARLGDRVEDSQRDGPAPGDEEERDGKEMEARKALCDGGIRWGRGQSDLSHRRRDAEMIDETKRRERERKGDGEPSPAQRPPEGRESDTSASARDLKRTEHAPHQLAGQIGARDHGEDGARDDRPEEEHGADPGAEGDPERGPQHGPDGRGHSRRWFPIAPAL